MNKPISPEATMNASWAIAGRQFGPDRFHAQNNFRSEWVHYTPPGYHDEPFDVPWTFTINQDGNPYRGNGVHLDDDAPYIVRGFFCPSLIGVGTAVLYDAYGRPLGTNSGANGITYNFGGWGFGGFAWPIDQELICPAGGIITIDFQLQNLGGTLTINGSFLGVKRRREC